MPDLPTAAPVFVDPTGKRRKHVRTTAVVSVAALVAVGGLLVAALFGAPLGPTASLPIPPPPSAPARPAPVVTTTEAPDRTSRVQTTAAPTSTTTTTSKAPATTTTSSAAGTTTKPGNTPPGRPSDLPRPTKPPR
ncbi:hypothetical protein [Actinokineospora xionganensis]|uniref:Serine/threonine protein kinase n=1 Tax=Actinokineospora xionganensis TaxID=2684470 RepID=A0ABR7L7C7_9PSEU|nr:hypothetical protein [Actinokineospora xionganensis]MBC6448482.1 hypothetical protein [Actinokineospora xionganensis]